MARSWLGITLIITTVASKPMMTMTTINSTRVNPRAARREAVHGETRRNDIRDMRLSEYAAAISRVPRC